MSSSLKRTENYWKIIWVVLLVVLLVQCQKTPSSKTGSLRKTAYSLFNDSLHLRYGIISRRGRWLDKKYFIISYNDTWKIPCWVAYCLTSQDLQGTTKRQEQFKSDTQLPIGARAELADYEKSGYDRGHMAPAADFKRSKQAMTTTFLLSNMSPQTPELNQKIWQKLEDAVRKKVKTDGKAWIITGNIFMSADSHVVAPSDFIGPNNVAVPTHCFKCILSCNKDNVFSMYTFLLPNQKTVILGKPVDYLLSVDRLEQITDYDFFPLLDDSIENRLECFKPLNWLKQTDLY